MFSRFRAAWSELRGVSKTLRELAAKVDELQRENHALLAALSLPPASEWRERPRPASASPTDNAFSKSTICRQESFETSYFPYWTERLGQELRYHRKLWEFVFICQALFERGALQAESKGLGFGVGSEPLAAFFASQGCRVLGTDMAADQAYAAGWSTTFQHAAGKAALAVPWICPPDLFDQNLDYRTVDMNAIPADLVGFDFCWSACALEHLGSIEHGLAFIERSLETLRPGGIAVHTTEYNLSSNAATLAEGSTVLFRRRDLEELARRLEAKGHHIAPLDLEPGLGAVDRYIDVPPYRTDPHLRLLLAGYVTTSVGVIIQRGAHA